MSKDDKKRQANQTLPNLSLICPVAIMIWARFLMDQDDVFSRKGGAMFLIGLAVVGIVAGVMTFMQIKGQGRLFGYIKALIGIGLSGLFLAGVFHDKLPFDMTWLTDL